MLCPNAILTCSDPGQIRYRIYFRDPPAEWIVLAEVCLAPGEGPVPMAQIRDAVRDRFENLPPENRPQFQPPDTALVNLPTIFAAGAPNEKTWNNLDVLGFDIKIEAIASFEWRFDSGVTRTFDVPGAPYPDKSVTYTYRTPGQRNVGLTTHWTGEFYIDGDGPYVIPGAVNKISGPIPVPVHEAKSELVAGGNR
jgi:hypothetical protein